MNAQMNDVLDTRSLHVIVHCDTCHQEWWSDGETTCTCPAALERWHEGRAHRHVFYSRPLLIPCAGAERQEPT